MKIKKLFFFVFCVLFYKLAAKFCETQTEGFSIARIHSELSYDPRWEIEPLSLEKQRILDSILSQPFRYLGCGGQCFAFESEDGNYVVKFFKHKWRKPYLYYASCPLPLPLDQKRKNKINKIRVKGDRDFLSYKIGYEDLQEETALLFIHLNKTTSFKRSIHLIDKLGIHHQVSLDEVEFIVQKKAKLVHSHFRELLQAGDLIGIRQDFRSLLNAIVARSKKGVFDEDPKVHRNFGFLNDRPIFIDVGRFIRDPSRTDPDVYRKDLLAISKRFYLWLQKTDPELLSILEQEFDALKNI